MYAVSLAAGAGTPIRPLSRGVSNPTLPVAGSPPSTHVADVAVDASANTSLEPGVTPAASATTTPGAPVDRSR